MNLKSNNKHKENKSGEPLNADGQPRIPSETNPEPGAKNPKGNGKTPHQKNDPTRNINIKDTLMVLATVIIAAATVAYSVIAHKQWIIMSTTLKEMKSSGDESKKQTDRMIAETNRIADAMTKTVDQSRKALDATIENFHLDQRAWVGQTIVTPAEYSDGDRKVYVKEGQKIRPEVWITNTGKTPALKVRHTYALHYLGPEINPLNTYTSLETYDSTSVMQPGTKLSLRPPSLPSEGNVTKEYIENITKGKKVVYVTGIITYSDVFKRSHSSKFCLRLTPDLTIFTTCATGNEVN